MKESEMTSPRTMMTTTSTTKGTVLAISRDMSQPTVEIEKDMTVGSLCFCFEYIIFLTF
jgi:hypothetical protein